MIDELKESLNELAMALQELWDKIKNNLNRIKIKDTISMK